MKKIFIVTAILALQACASMETDNKKFLEIKSEPEEADVWLNGEVICQTPCKYNVTGARNEIFKITVQKDGYGSYEKELLPKTHKKVENDLLWCIIPPVGLTMLGIDYYTGSMWDYNKVDAILYRNNYNATPTITSGINLSLAAERYINDNFSRLKEEAFAVDASKERIRTLSSLTSVPVERITGMVSESNDAAQLIGFLKRFGS